MLEILVYFLSRQPADFDAEYHLVAPFTHGNNTYPGHSDVLTCTNLTMKQEFCNAARGCRIVTTQKTYNWIDE